MTGIESTKSVHLVGCGPGGSEWVLPRARRVVAGADVVFGPSDLVALFPEAKAARMDLPSRPETAAPLVRAAWEKGLSCVVLVRGDCGLHSLAKGLQARLPPGACRRVPGLSSVQVACAAFGLDWEGAHIASAHGRDLEIDPSGRSARLLVVLGGGEGFAPLLEATRRDLGARHLHLACDLTLPTERLLSLSGSDPVPADLPSRTIALFETVRP
jgi:cobalt-precorrin-7 (C5)-methyltransferase